MKYINKIYSKKLMFLLSVCMGISHILNSQVVVENVNYARGTYNYCATTSITSPSLVTKPAKFSGTANVYYTTGQYIDLKPGFTAGVFSTTGEFIASIGLCPIVVSNKFNSSSYCTYTVTANINQIGAGCPLKSQTYEILNGQSKTYNFIPDPGCSLNPASLTFNSKTGTCGQQNWNLNSSVQMGNCYACTGNTTQVTVWTNNDPANNNNFEIRRDLSVGARYQAPTLAISNVAETQTDEMLNLKMQTDIKNDANLSITNQLYPNPTSNGQFTFITTNKNNKSVVIYDVTGKIVFKKENTLLQTFDIDITNYPKGMYYVKIIGDNEIWSGKIISE